MVKVRSENETQRNWVQGSANSYLNGKNSLNWIIGIVRSSNISKEELETLLVPLRESYPDNLRLSQLEITCKENGFL